MSGLMTKPTAVKGSWEEEFDRRFDKGLRDLIGVDKWEVKSFIRKELKLTREQSIEEFVKSTRRDGGCTCFYSDGKYEVEVWKK